MSLERLSIGEKYLALTNEVREKGDALRALLLADEAVYYLLQEGNLVRAAEAFAAKLLAYRHLYQKTNDRSYLLAGKHAVMTGVEIAELSGDKTALAIPYFNLAKVQEELGDVATCVDSYKKAAMYITNNPPPSHNRPGVVADFKIHLAIAEYSAGDKSALGRAEKAIEELKNSGERNVSKYNEDVWVSGGYMRMAEVVRVDDPKKAEECLTKAKEVIDSNPELTIRMDQWKVLAEKIGKVVTGIFLGGIQLSRLGVFPWNRAAS